MLYVIGLGLSDEKDITVKGLEVSLAMMHVDKYRMRIEGKCHVWAFPGREEMRASVSRGLHQYSYGPKRAISESCSLPSFPYCFPLELI